MILANSGPSGLSNEATELDEGRKTAKPSVTESSAPSHY
jgi:hypothetical protein